MLKRASHFSILTLFFLFLAVLQFFFISALPGAWQYFNLGIITIAFSLFLFDLKPTLYFILIFGFFLDFFSFQFFSFHILILLATTMVAYFFLNSLLTNKSLYSFWAIILINVFIYNILSALILFFASSFQDRFLILQVSFWEGMFYQALWGLLIAALFFNFLVTLIKKFKPFFLEKTGKI